jgi:thiol:disulfide interchange protein DsbA
VQMFRRLLVTTALLTLSGLTFAAPVAPKEGVHYQVLPQKLETPAGKPVEVIEFFAYYCPHCNVFEPLLAEWVKKQGNNIVFKRVHIASGARVLPQQRLFYALSTRSAWSGNTTPRPLPPCTSKARASPTTRK